MNRNELSFVNNLFFFLLSFRNTRNKRQLLVVVIALNFTQETYLFSYLRTYLKISHESYYFQKTFFFVCLPFLLPTTTNQLTITSFLLIDHVFIWKGSLLITAVKICVYSINALLINLACQHLMFSLLPSVLCISTPLRPACALSFCCLKFN